MTDKNMKIGDSVKVKKGVKDPDLNTYDMSDWQGRIQSFGKDDETGELLVQIQWDSITLRLLPKDFIADSIEEECDFSEMVLSETDLLKCMERDSLFDVQQAKEMIELACFWNDSGEQGKRIKSVIAQCKNSFNLIDKWFEHLEETLELPCKVFYIGDSIRGLRPDAEIVLDGILDSDSVHGVIGSGKYDRKNINIPLCDVKPVVITPQNQSLDDYAVWFANQ